MQLPGVIAGGSEPETPDVARAAAPGRVQSLGRLVGLSDFQAEALALPGVALASATWGIAHGVPTVTVTILMEHGRQAEHAAVAEALRSAARDRGADRFEIEVVQGRFRNVKLRADVAIAAGYDADAVLAATRDALGVDPAPDGLFSVNRRRFGQAEHTTHVTGVIQQVSGVSWARLAGSDKDALVPYPDRVLRLPSIDLAAVTGATSLSVRVPLYDRLPEVYRIEDAKQDENEPLRALLALLEQTFGAVHENIEALYHDLFIETCDPWAIPYIADLLGTSTSQATRPRSGATSQARSAGAGARARSARSKRSPRR